MSYAIRISGKLKEHVKEGKMEAFEDKVIFSKKFPDARPEAVLKKAEELCRAVPADQRLPVPPFEDMMGQIREKYAYKSKPGAEKRSVMFVSLAKAVCGDFEIDTEITKKKYEIDVTMDLDYGWYGGNIKRALDALLKLADDFNLTCNQNRPDCVRLSMSYHTHNLYSHGEKVEWW